MFGNILQRSIFWELLKSFLLALIALTGILLLAGIVAEASQRGLTPTQILAAIPLIVPSLMPYVIPSTTLFSTCLVYGRLAHDNEIIAIKAAGINLMTVVWPALLMGALTTAITMGFYCQLIPETQYILRTDFLKDVEEFLYSMLKNDRTINHPKLGYAIWVRQVQGRRLVDATFKRRDEHGNYNMVAHAREAELRIDTVNKQVLVHMRHGEVYSICNGTRAYFEDKVWPVPMAESPLTPSKERKAREMNIQQIVNKRVELMQEIDQLGSDIAMAVARLAMGGAPDDLPRHRQNLETKRKQIHRDLLCVLLEGYMRPTIAAGCMCFVLVGCPIGIWFSKSDYLSAFITCFLPIVLVYYPMLLCGLNLARYGRGHPLVLLWPCNILMIVIGLCMLRRLIRY